MIFEISGRCDSGIRGRRRLRAISQDLDPVEQPDGSYRFMCWIRGRREAANLVSKLEGIEGVHDIHLDVEMTDEEVIRGILDDHAAGVSLRHISEWCLKSPETVRQIIRRHKREGRDAQCTS